MALTVRKITIWRKEIPHTPGEAAAAFAPLAEAGASLGVAMGYRIPGDASKAILEIAPVSGKKAEGAARGAGFSPSSLPALEAQGDDRPGLGRAITAALAEAGINLAFLVAQVVGRRWTAIFGFEGDADLAKAAPIIRKAAGKPARRTRRR